MEVIRIGQKAMRGAFVTLRDANETEPGLVLFVSIV